MFFTYKFLLTLPYQRILILTISNSNFVYVCFTSAEQHQRATKVGGWLLKREKVIWQILFIILVVFIILRQFC